MDLHVEQAEHLCDGFGWFDTGETYCLRPDGAVTTDLGTQILPPGTVPNDAVSQVRFGLLVVEPRGGTSFSLFDLDKGNLVETITDPSKTRPVMLGRGCVAWLRDDSSVGTHQLAVWKAGQIMSWGQVPWSAIEAVEDCDNAIIGRGGLHSDPTFYRTTTSETVIVGSGDMRFDGACAAAVDLDADLIRVVCRAAAERTIPLPPFDWDPGYTMVWQFRAERRWGVLVHAAPGVMFAAVRSSRRRARAHWAEVHFGPGPEVPVAVLDVRGKPCVGWISNQGQVTTGMWRSCVSTD
ncbi:MAG: hypothetical protein H6738_12185 [Alphaproteobacteria bacterium]|nr:hypothetical protein [Alphaproteobacteria bacterium]